MQWTKYRCRKQGVISTIPGTFRISEDEAGKVPAAQESWSVVWRPGVEKRHWRTVREEWRNGVKVG
jgi:hypothetical protein